MRFFKGIVKVLIKLSMPFKLLSLVLVVIFGLGGGAGFMAVSAKMSSMNFKTMWYNVLTVFVLELTLWEIVSSIMQTVFIKFVFLRK